MIENGRHEEFQQTAGTYAKESDQTSRSKN